MGLGVVMLRETDDRPGILGTIESELDDTGPGFTANWGPTKFGLTEGDQVGYVQKRDKMSFFINMTTVSVSFYLLSDPPTSSGCPAAHCRDPKPE